MNAQPPFRPIIERVLRWLCTLVLAFGCIGAGGRAVSAAASIQEIVDQTAAGGTANIPAGTYTENVVINKNITLAGSSSTETIIHPAVGSTAPVIQITAATQVTVTIRDLTISGARVTSGEGGAISAGNSNLIVHGCTLADNQASYGGAIHVAQGSLTVSESTIQNNRATLADGGGIYSGGELTLNNTLVAGNTAVRHGGGAHGNAGLVTVNGSLFDSNTATSGNGGGLNMNDALTINYSTFSNNTAGGDGGGVLQWNMDRQVTITHSRFSSNSAKRNGGGMAAKGNVNAQTVTFTANIADSASSTNTAGGGLYVESGSLYLISGTFTDNRTRCNMCSAMYGGGLAIRNSTDNQVSFSSFMRNISHIGGGIFRGGPDNDLYSGSLLLYRSTFLFNKAGENGTAGYGGGLHGMNVNVLDSAFEENEAGDKGGGLFARGTYTLERLRVLRNTAGVRGGGLYLTDTPTIRNVAVVDNAIRNNYGTGSGITLDEFSRPVTLQQVTISNNTGGNGAGLQVESKIPGALFTLSNMIIANQQVGVCISNATASVTIRAMLFNNNTDNIGLSPGCYISYTYIFMSVNGDPAFAPDGYHITPGSAAIKKGERIPELTDDIDGNARPETGYYDLGADQMLSLWLPVVVR